MTICVVGLGKIGLPLGVQYASKGQQVWGLDINLEVIEKINRAEAPFPGENELSEKLIEVVNAGNLKATNNYELSVSNSNVIVVVVPLVVGLDNNPDFSNYDVAVGLISRYVKRGTLICFETTLPVGTTRKRFCPIIEKNSGLKIGKDLYVVFSPERVSSGKIFEDLRKYPKIVGGITQKCGEVAREFYEQVLDFDERRDLDQKNGVWLMKTSEEAEMTKIAETTYRDVNIALANQFFLFCEKNGINFYHVVKAANSQYLSHIHMPGISVGGHCIPVYPYFYLLNDKQGSIVQEARNQNEKMPSLSIKLILQNLGSLKKKNVLIEGISYRTNVKEVYGSGVWALIPLLKKEEATVYIHDSKYSETEIKELNLGEYIYNGQEIDLIIIHTLEKDSLNFIKEVSNLRTQIFDGRNYLADSDIAESATIFGFTKPRGK